MRSLFKAIGWLFSKAWWLLDGTRRALMNLVVLALLVVLVVGWLGRAPRPLADKTTLVLKLDGQLVEQFSGTPREQLAAQARGGSLPQQTRLRDVLAALDAAARDDKISTLLLDVDDLGGAGVAGLHEVAAALQRFKASGKPVLAYGDSFSQRGYFLAAQASQAFLHPMGMVTLQGFGGRRIYFKEALDRVGVTAHVVKVGTYKSFAEPYTASGPSPASQEAEGLVYGELWKGYTGAVEQARKLEPGSIMRGIDELPQRLAALKGDPAQLALQAKLVDGLKTRDQMRELLIERGARDAASKSFRQIGLGDYLARLPQDSGPAAIAVVVAEGEIVDGSTGPGRIGGDSTARLVRQAREDDTVKALVLRVNSPGGSAFASEIIRRELELTRQAGKPVVVSMGDVAASGGYWISMASDAVIADPGTITGSIGVFAILPTAEGLMDKLSLRTGGTTTTWLAGGYDPRRPLDPRLQAALQSGVEGTYARFTGLAAQARKRTPEQIDAVAQGRIWTGAQALERGLIDRTGSLDDALRTAAQLIKQPTPEGTRPRVRYLERELSRTDRLIASLADVVAPPLLDALSARLLPTSTQLAADALATPATAEDLAALRLLGQAAAQGRWDRATAAHCLCSTP